MKRIMTPAVLQVFDILNDDVRLVGGCVRDYLMREPIGDVDMATPLPPEIVMQKLQNAEVKVIPTGLKHGTVTAIINKQSIEITTLRKDIRTDGRHADVVWADKYEEDAQRRDFTVNALYMDRAKKIYDYVGGLDDLKARRIRFIGNPEKRISEDYLRILRFFRFFARFGVGVPDKVAVKACEKLKGGLEQISRERKTAELLKMLMAHRVADALKVMQKTGVLGEVLSGAKIDRLKKLLDVYPEANVWERLSVLGGDTEELVLSKMQRRELIILSKRINVGQKLTDDLVCLSDVGHGVFRFYLYRALSEEKISPRMVAARQKLVKPQFTITGKDLVKAGFAPGVEIKVLLDQAKMIWVQEGFTGKKNLVIQKLLDYNGTKSGGNHEKH